MVAPNRSLEQRLTALSTANAVRTFRGDLKKDVKAGKISVVKLLENPPEEIKNMKIPALLLAAPKIGQVKVNRILNRCRISPTKTVGGLSPRQRDALLSLMYR